VLTQIIMLIATTVTNLWLAGCLLWQFMMEKDLFQCENTSLTTEEILQYLTPVINMGGRTREQDSGKVMLRVGMLINIQNISMQHMKHPCKEMNTAGVNIDILTWRGHIANLAQNAFEVIITPVIRMAITPAVTKLVTAIRARMVKNFLQPVDLRRPTIKQSMSSRLQLLK